MNIISISRDPFARSTTVRQKASGACAWCGSPAKFRYGTHADGLTTRADWQKQVFCGRSCERTFNS